MIKYSLFLLFIVQLHLLVAQEDAEPYAELPDFSFAEEELEPQNLWRTEAKLSNQTAFGGKIFRSDSRSNPDNRLELRPVYFFSEFELQASATLMRQTDDIEAGLATRKRLSLVTSFYTEVSNDKGRNPLTGNLPPELGDVSFGFRQLYASFFADLAGAELELSFGKQAYSQGVSIYFNPINYLDDSGSFFDEKNNIQVLMALAWPSFTLRLRYMPVLRFHSDSELQANILEADPEAYSSWEYVFAFAESRNRRQLLSLEAAMFLGQSNIGLMAYVMEKDRYNWDSGFYGAIGASVQLPFYVANQYFQIYSEGLLGNGIEKFGQLKESPWIRLLGQPPKYLWYDADLDPLQFRGLLGLQWGFVRNLDLYLEYRYDGSALAPQQLQRYLDGLEDYNRYNDPRQALFWQGSLQRGLLAQSSALSQHILALSVNWRNIAEHFDMQASYFFSLSDSSSTLLFRGGLFLLQRQLEIYLKNYWFLPSLTGSPGAFGSVPYLGSLEIGLKLER